MSDENKQDIYIGEISFALLKTCGVWASPEWTSKWKLIPYRVLTVFIVTIYFTMTCCIIINMCQKHENVEEVSQSIFFSITFLLTVSKITMILKKREIFLKTQEMLAPENCRLRDSQEVEILRNYSLKGRKISICYWIIVHLTGMAFLLAPLAAIPEMTLPIPHYSPFSLKSKLVFSLSYLQQIICVIVCVNVNAGIETLAITILLNMCGQLEILMHRFKSLSKLPNSIHCEFVKYHQESEILHDCIKRHLYMRAIGENINKQFGIIIFVQFFSSMILLCVIIYNLSKMSLTNQQSWVMIISASSYTLEIFIYCYCGQLMTEKSLDIGTAVYFLKWESLTIQTKKSIVIVMMQSVRPIKLTASSVIIMSLESFMKVIKSAYSAYNLMKNS